MLKIKTISFFLRHFHLSIMLLTCACKYFCLGDKEKIITRTQVTIYIITHNLIFLYTTNEIPYL